MPLRSPSEILDAATDAGIAKAAGTNTGGLCRLLTGSILAGAYIALGGTLSVAIGYGFPEITAANPGLQKLLSGLVFPIGLMLVVILGADLFTGNNALLVPPLVQRKLTVGKVLSNWIIVWTGNFAGALAMAYFLVYLPGVLQQSCYTEALTSMALAKTTMPAGVVFLKGIGANWCVCLAIWLALSGRHLGEKLLACEIPVFAFVALGYEHCVANMFFLPLAAIQGAPVGTIDILINNLLPATAGNIIGGAVFVGLSQYYIHRRRK